MFTKLSLIKRIIRWISLKAFTYVENNNIANFKTNGEEVFINNLLSELKQKKEKIIIFDIGANIGEYTELLIDKLSSLGIDNYEIHLFEPTKKCFQVLKSKFDDNKRIHLNNIGVSNNKGQSTIYYDAEKSGLASLYKRNLDHYNIEFNDSEIIELDTLELYIKTREIKHIDFLKIDIEGHELSAFEGMGMFLNSSFIDFIQFEYGGANLDSHTSLLDFYLLFQKNDFIVNKILPSGLETRSYKPFMDNFNYSNYVAISKKINNLIR